MALFHLKRIEGPVPALSSGNTGWLCVIIDRADPAVKITHQVDVANDSLNKYCDILQNLNTAYTPNDFNYTDECT